MKPKQITAMQRAVYLAKEDEVLFGQGVVHVDNEGNFTHIPFGEIYKKEHWFKRWVRAVKSFLRRAMRSERKGT